MEAFIPALENALEEAKQAGREIYYAMTFLPPRHSARANLEAALSCLGIRKPGDVGLSESVLTRRNYNDA
jgi:hypothetical protein